MTMLEVKRRFVENKTTETHEIRTHTSRRSICYKEKRAPRSQNKNIREDHTKLKKTMDKAKKNSNVRWGKIQSRFFIEFLAEEARAGKKVGKAFRNATMVAAAKAVNESFPNLNVSEANCVNHYRTLKTRWAMIKNIKGLSGVFWDEDTKTIVMGEEQYKTYVAAHPNTEAYINKPIELFEEMALICGDDSATGSFARSLGEPMCTPTDDVEGTQPTPGVCPSAMSIQFKKSGSKRTQNDMSEERGEGIAKGLTEVAAAFDMQVWSDRLYVAIKDMKDFSPSIQNAAYEYLMLNNVHGRMFLSRDHADRVAWLENFMLDRL